MSITDVILETTTSDKIKVPKKYKVIFCNDNVTPVEFVVAVLMSVFKHEQNAAMEITLKVHNEGSAVAGIYSYEIAEQKSIDVMALARSNGYPLQVKVEAE